MPYIPQGCENHPSRASINTMRPTIAEIHLPALRRNYARLHQAIRGHAGPDALTLAVVKANAYGHGLAPCSRALVAEGASWLGVTSVKEAAELRGAIRSASTRVLVMSGFFPGEEGLVLRHGIAAQLWEPWHLSLLDAAARRAGLPRASVPVHLEIDTGMSRQGVAPGDPLAHLLRSAGLAEPGSPLYLEGLLTHFSSPEDALPSAPLQNNSLQNDKLQPAPDARLHLRPRETPPPPGDTLPAQQLARFRSAAQQVSAAGLHPRLLHAGNSINALHGVELPQLAALARELGAAVMVRPGIALYGCGLAPSHRGPALEPVLRWRTQITSLRTIASGTAVGYNETFHAARTTRLALVPVGYADGLDRALSNRGCMLVRGQRAPIVGRISMDQATLDVTGISGAALGDEVILLGPQHGDAIPAEELAALTGTIPYEVLCRIALRVPRIPVD